MALCKAAVRRVGGQEMVGSHHGQAASCEGVSMGAEGQERVARAVVGSEGGGGQACDTMGGRDVEPDGAAPRWDTHEPGQRRQQGRRKGEGGEAQRGSAR